jgi:hypothetical protein
VGEVRWCGADRDTFGNFRFANRKVSEAAVFNEDSNW